MDCQLLACQFLPGAGCHITGCQVTRNWIASCWCASPCLELAAIKLAANSGILDCQLLPCQSLLDCQSIGPSWQCVVTFGPSSCQNAWSVIPNNCHERWSEAQLFPTGRMHQLFAIKFQTISCYRFLCSAIPRPNTP